MMAMPRANTGAPSRSFKKLVPRATEGPLIAPTRWRSSEPATRGSYTTGQRQVATLRAPRRRTARSPARRPTVAASSRSPPWTALE